MKSPEQMGGLPEQPNNAEEIMENKEEKISENPERKITTPEEAAEMTRQRRKEYGLEEQERKESSPEAMEAQEQWIAARLEDLNSHDYESFSPEIQEQWYWVEQEAMVGKDRALAATQLGEFLEALQKKAEKSEKE